MNFRRIACLLLLSVLAALSLPASDPWKEKPYTEWTEEDVTKIQQNSPWARSVAKTLWMREPGDVRTPGSRPATDLAGEVAPRITPEHIRIYVQWASSVTVRQAYLRERQLQQSETNLAPAPELAHDPPKLGEYVIVIVVAGDRLLNVDIEQAEIYLQPQGSKLKIAPSNDWYGPAEEMFPEMPFPGMEFTFPHEVDGKPVLSPNEKKVKFYLKSRETKIDVEFDLTKMVRDGKPDL